jgi:hypothetical protein
MDEALPVAFVENPLDFPYRPRRKRSPQPVTAPVEVET